ncbi:MAG: HAMP domain-containing histidine kinase [Chthoniobacterales bacterium]|nr:HAMP domain-containing histidine kinase [Chthoniobacterales bacterium]
MSEIQQQHATSAATEIHVPMADVVRFIRQLSHDLRNHLNAAELQAAYVKEIVDDGEVKEEIQRLRGMVWEFGASLQKLTAALAAVKLTQMPYDASLLVEDLQQKSAQQFGNDGSAFEWDAKVPNAPLNIDPQLLQQAVLELLSNALAHNRAKGKISVTAELEGDQFVLTLKEPKTSFEASTENWGREPFKLVKHGHYGLGLHRARSIIEAHEGTLTACYESGASALVTRVSLPIANDS